MNIRPVILNDEDPEYTTTGIYFGSEAILRIRGMLEHWKANFPNSLKKDYVPFEESNVKFYRMVSEQKFHWI